MPARHPTWTLMRLMRTGKKVLSRSSLDHSWVFLVGSSTNWLARKRSALYKTNRMAHFSFVRVARSKAILSCVSSKVNRSDYSDLMHLPMVQRRCKSESLHHQCIAREFHIHLSNWWQNILKHERSAQFLQTTITGHLSLSARCKSSLFDSSRLLCITLLVS